MFAGSRALSTHSLTAVASLPFWGTSYYIPGTNFCTYDAERDQPSRVITNIVYKLCSVLLEAIVLLLTLHRLMEHGISGLWRHRKAIGLTPLPKVLISQGFIYFVMVVIVDVIFLALYFSTPSSDPGLQLAGSALVFSIQPMMAARLYLTVGKASNVRHIPAIDPPSLDSEPSVETLAGSPSVMKRQSQGPCSCNLNVDNHAIPFHPSSPKLPHIGSGAFQHEASCARRMSRPPLSPRSPILPMHALPRRLTSSAISQDSGKDEAVPFERRLTLPLTGQAAAPTTGIHIQTDTVSEVSAEDTAAHSFFHGVAASTQLAADAESSKSRATTHANQSAASLAETLAGPELSSGNPHL